MMPQMRDGLEKLKNGVRFPTALMGLDSTAATTFRTFASNFLTTSNGSDTRL